MSQFTDKEKKEFDNLMDLFLSDNMTKMEFYRMKELECKKTLKQVK